MSARSETTDRLTELGRNLERARAEVFAAEQRIAATVPKTDERRVALEAKELALANMRETKEAIKAENMRRNFAGIGSPLHAALLETLDVAAVTALERRAMDLLAERERANEARRAAKATQAEPPLEPSPPAPSRRDLTMRALGAEVIRARPAKAAP